MSPTPRQHLIAALAALHLLAVVLMAMPAPGGGMNRSTWKDPTVQGEFAAWSERLRALGLDLGQQELEDQAWRFAQAWMGARARVLAPFKPYYRYAGTVQSWRMFVAPHRFPTRLEIAVQEGGAWRVVYRERDPDAAWRGRWLDHDRFRSVIFRFGWKPYRTIYRQFGAWIAGHAARDFPEADRARVYLVRYRTLSPEQVRAGEAPNERITDAQEYNLRALRGAP